MLGQFITATFNNDLPDGNCNDDCSENGSETYYDIILCCRLNLGIDRSLDGLDLSGVKTRGKPPSERFGIVMGYVRVEELASQNPVVIFTSVLDADLAFNLLGWIVIVDVVNWLLLVPNAADVEEYIGHFALLGAVNHVARFRVDSVAACVSA